MGSIIRRCDMLLCIFAFLSFYECMRGQEIVPAHITSELPFDKAEPFSKCLVKRILISDSVKSDTFSNKELFCLFVEERIKVSEKGLNNEDNRIFCNDSIINKLYVSKIKKTRLELIGNNVIDMVNVRFGDFYIKKSNVGCLKTNYLIDCYNIKLRFILLTNISVTYVLEIYSLMEANGKFFMLDPDFDLRIER